MKKKLLITTDCFLPRWDGIARFLSLLIPELKQDYDITVIAPEFPGRVKIEGVRILRMPLRPQQFGDIQFSKVDRKKVREEVSNADIVFNQTIGPIGMAAIKEASRLKKLIVSYVHSIEWELASKGVKRFKWLVKLYVKNIARRLYSKCTLLLVPSQDVADVLNDNRITTKKTVVKLGVDTARFLLPLTRAIAKKALGINVNNIVIGYLGRIAREKDIDTLHKAFRRLLKKYSNITLLIVGKGIEEEKYCTQNIVMAGAVNNAVPYLQAIDVYVLPSLTETSSLSTMEAMACGCAVLTTPVGNTREYIKEGVTGMFFPRKDAARLAEKLELLINDARLRSQLGKKAREHIVKEHQWKETAVVIKAILKSLS